MKTTARNGAAWLKGRIVIDRSAIDPPGSEAVLRRLGLLPELDEELAKNDRESAAIEEAQSALNSVRLASGLYQVRLNPGHFHLVTEKEFWNRWGHVRRAFTQFGHVYLPRRFLFLCFLQDLTHEMVHLSSFRAVIDPTESDKDRAVKFLRSGFSPVVGSPSKRRRLFVGFDEGVTELIAIEVRRRLASRTDLLEPRQAEILANDWSYEAQVLLVSELVKLAGEDADATVKWRLFAGYFNRSSAWLKALDRARPGIRRILKDMDGPAEALAAAEKLGLYEAAGRIRRIMNRRRRR